MSTRRKPAAAGPQDTVARLAASLEEAMDLLREAAYNPGAPAPVVEQDAGLLEQCLRLCEQQEAAPVEPVRTVEHLACSGGTLICKCLGLMPNVQLLSEIDPLSPLALTLTPGRPRFAPTDLNLQWQQGTRGSDPAALVALFQAEVRVLHEQAARRALHLVLRVHSHSQFCTGPAVPERLSVRQLLPPELTVRSVVTVRHPIDSYAALVSENWVHFTPATFAEFCRRYLAFLDLHAEWPLLRYEDFVDAPAATMQTLCEQLALPYNPDFQRLLSLMHLTGDSGRSSDAIARRPRRPAAVALQQASVDLPDYRLLADRLGYAPH